MGMVLTILDTYKPVWILMNNSKSLWRGVESRWWLLDGYEWLWMAMILRRVHVVDCGGAVRKHVDLISFAEGS